MSQTCAMDDIVGRTLVCEKLVGAERLAVTSAGVHFATMNGVVSQQISLHRPQARRVKHARQ